MALATCNEMRCIRLGTVPALLLGSACDILLTTAFENFSPRLRPLPDVLHQPRPLQPEFARFIMKSCSSHQEANVTVLSYRGQRSPPHQ